jgi:gluconate 2-dehydrogenase gamma chain
MDITRRNALKIIGVTPVAAGIGLSETTAAEEQAAHQHGTPTAKTAGTKRAPYKPKFFNAHEWATVTLLANIVIPKDERSGSATEAGVPEFIDFMMIDRPDGQVPMRGGLRWLDSESNSRFGTSFREATEAQRTELLDDIAYPRKAKPEFSHGVAFFSRFRDMVATGFWTSKMGIQDLQYQGNVPNPSWNGCPDNCYTHLGVTKA